MNNNVRKIDTLMNFSNYSQLQQQKIKNILRENDDEMSLRECLDVLVGGLSNNDNSNKNNNNNKNN